MTWRRWVYPGLLGLVVVCFAPVYSVWWASSLAEANGCILHEGNITPCIVDEEDIGPRLYEAFVLGWLMLATLPVAAIAGGALLVLLVRDAWHRWRKG